MKVKVTGFWADDLTLLSNLTHYGFGQPVWKDMELVTGEDYDRLVILTEPHADCKDYNPAKAITLLTEPPSSPHRVAHPSAATIPMYLPLPFWKEFTDKDWTLLRAPEVPKSEWISCVTSDLRQLEGHQARLQLVSVLDRAIEEGLDVWGRQYHRGFFPGIGSYRGTLKNKYDALWAYRYHFACENSLLDDYFTEKIVDPILAECLCFYDGCLNLEAYIDERAFIRIDVFDPVSSVRTIVESMEAGEWEKRIGYIRTQKARLLRELNPLNIIWLSVHGRDVRKECML